MFKNRIYKVSLEIIESSNAKKSWSTKKCISLAIFSLIIGTLIFAIAYISMSQNVYIGTYNQKVLSWLIAHRNAQITAIMSIVSLVSSPIALSVFILIIAIIWSIIKREIWRPLLLASTMVVGAFLSIILKLAIANNRPPQISMVLPIETSYSFPSGHVLGATVFLLTLGYLIFSRRSNILLTFFWTILAALVIAAVALSRLYLGYHWTTDTIASLGLGFVILSVAIFIDRIVVNHLNR